jgi:DoxX-like family
MQSESPSAPVSKGMFWTGWVLTALPALFLLVDAVMKFVKPDFVVEGTVKYGYSESVIFPLGVVLFVCTVLYLVRPTAVLGAILLTGYLGGAVATHVIAKEGLFEIVFPVIFGALLWGGLVLRDARLRSVVPWRSSSV